jgi:hypothetical protein
LVGTVNMRRRFVQNPYYAIGYSLMEGVE